MNKGFTPIIAVLIFSGAILAAFFVFKSPKSSMNDSNQQPKNSLVTWNYDQTSKSWSVVGSPPKCLDPLVFPSPVDVNLATGILYPGQERGGDYKPHGGFRFDSLEDNEVNVYAPFEGSLVKAARHTSGNEIQYVIYVVNDCGIMYKLDHLRELTDKFEKIMETIPLAGDNDTRTTGISPSIFVAKGEHVATKVGLETGKNVFFDFGVYDLRTKNRVVYSEDMKKKHYNIEEVGNYATCWLDFLEEPERSIAKSLPGADGQSGTKSDYCH